ncbi:MAG TPA: GNAT family protein [Terriglobales bacterium]|nr:GNAT family protein [Terriglobales bacterium]
MIRLGDVVLRPLEPRDVASLYSFRNDWEVIQYLGGFSAGYSRKNLEEWVTAHRNRADEVLWTIADACSDKSIGHVGLYKIDNRVRKAEFAIVIGDRGSWGKGLGRKVTQAVVDWGFEQLNLHKVSLSVLAFNKRAIELYRSLGFRQEGALRDEQFRSGRYHGLVLMSLLDREWRAHKRRRG